MTTDLRQWKPWEIVVVSTAAVIVGAIVVIAGLLTNP